MQNKGKLRKKFDLVCHIFCSKTCWSLALFFLHHHFKQHLLSSHVVVMLGIMGRSDVTHSDILPCAEEEGSVCVCVCVCVLCIMCSDLQRERERRAQQVWLRFCNPVLSHSVIILSSLCHTYINNSTHTHTHTHTCEVCTVCFGL